MRRIPFIIIWLLLTCLSACKRHAWEPAGMERLADSCPDVALHLLDSLREELPSTRPVRMRHALLTAWARNVTGDTFTSVDSFRNVWQYYQSHGSRHDRMMADYLMGRMYADTDDAPEALRHYLHAAAQADTAAPDCDWCHLSRIYGQMAGVYHAQMSPRKEMEAERLAVRYALRAGEPVVAIDCYSHLAGVYYMEDKTDSALQVLLESARLFRQYGAPQEAYTLLPSIIAIHLQQEKYELAGREISEFELRSGYVDSLGNVAAGMEHFYYQKGKYLEHVGRPDSAVLLYRKLLCFPTLNNLESAYEGLYSAYGQMGITDSLAKYAREYALANDRHNVAQSSTEVNRLQAAWQETSTRKRLAHETLVAERRKVMLAVIPLVFLSVVVFLLYVWRRKNRQKKEEIEQLQQKFQEAETRLRTAQHHKNVGVADNPVAQGADPLSPCVDLFRQYAAHGRAATARDWKSLETFVFQAMPRFHQYLRGPSATLSDAEFYVAVLIRLRFTPKEIACLTDKSIQRVTNIRASINRKLFHTDGTRRQDWMIGNIEA